MAIDFGPVRQTWTGERPMMPEVTPADSAALVASKRFV